jgi:hypothetical protein
MKNLKIYGIIALLTIIGAAMVYAAPNSGTYVEQSTGYEMYLSGGKGARSGRTWGTVSVTAEGSTTTGTWVDYGSSVVITFDAGFLSGQRATYNYNLNRLTGNGEVWVRR